VNVKQLRAAIAKSACPCARFTVSETRPANFVVVFRECNVLNLDTLANILGSTDDGGWQTDPGTLQIEGLDCSVTLIANGMEQVK
jgi:hypothetical protein